MGMAAGFGSSLPETTGKTAGHIGESEAAASSRQALPGGQDGVSDQYEAPVLEVGVEAA